MKLIDDNLLHRIKDKIQGIVNERGMDLVDFRIFWQAGQWVVRSLIDYPEGGITIDECSSINRLIFSFINREKFLGNDFNVEVNSPGLDRPLKEPKDFLRAKGKIVSVWLKERFEGKDYLEALIEDVKESVVLIRVQDSIFEIPFSLINIAKRKVQHE